MRRLLRYIYRNLLPARIKQSIDIFPYLRVPYVDSLKEKRVIVLSPHPDDDIIACGGTVYKYHLMGSEITVVYMTDGRKGNHQYKEEELVLIRRDEAQKAAAAVGINKLIFLNNRDSELALSRKTVKELFEILMNHKPEAVFLPFFLDNHHDHSATSQIFLSAASSLASCVCYLYGIWTPLPTFNVISDITACLEMKIRALHEHKSQLELADLVGAVTGMSRYYSVMNNGNGYVEPFLACSLDEYRKLGDIMGW
ncbi:MAG: PIG-L family deacetylase [wastewater metagenome]|nr:PIG-L family deacetylase [Candidatus Loosdrechtia aerotolerans]